MNFAHEGIHTIMHDCRWSLAQHKISQLCIPSAVIRGWLCIALGTTCMMLPSALDTVVSTISIIARVAVDPSATSTAPAAAPPPPPPPTKGSVSATRQPCWPRRSRSRSVQAAARKRGAARYEGGHRCERKRSAVLQQGQAMHPLWRMPSRYSGKVNTRRESTFS